MLHSSLTHKRLFEIIEKRLYQNIGVVNLLMIFLGKIAQNSDPINPSSISLLSNISSDILNLDIQKKMMQKQEC